MSQVMRRIVAACAFVGLVVSIVPASHAAFTELSAANELAAKGIIVDQSADPAEYRLGQNVLRQEAVGVAGRVRGVIPNTDPADYDCQGVYSDVDEDWVCRAAELSAEANIVDPVATGGKFNPKRNVSRYEAMLMGMKASCLNPVELGEGESHVDQTADAAAKAGVIASASAFDADRAATRGEVFLYAASLMEFAAENPDSQDDSIDGCGEDDDLDLCDLLPDLPGCEDDSDDDDDDDDVVVGGGDLTASLSDDSPESDRIPKNGRSIYTIFDVEAGDDDVVIEEILIERAGNGSDNDFENVWILENGVPVTNDRSINSDDEANFTGLNWVVEAGETRTFAIEAQMDASGNKENRLNVVGIVIDGGDVSGLPIIGEEMLTIDYEVSEIDFESRGSDTTVDVGEEEVTVAEFKITNDSSEDKDIYITSIRLENNGSADVEDLANLMLYRDGTLVSDDYIVDGDYITFIFDDGYTIEDGDSRNFQVKADILDGDDGDTYIFALTEDYDVRGYEEGSAIGIVLKSTVTIPVTLKTYTVDAGRFSISLDTSSPSAEDYARGTDDIIALIAKVDAGQEIASEGVRVYLDDASQAFEDTGSDDIADTAPGSASALEAVIENDLDNVRLQVNGRTVDSLDEVTCGGTDEEDCYYDFDTDFTLEDDDLIQVVVNLDDNALYTNEYGFTIDSGDFTDLEYVSNGDNVASGDISGSAEGKLVTIKSAEVTLARNDGFGGEEFVAGVTGETLLKFIVDAGTASDIKVSRLGFDVAVSVCGGADVDDFFGWKLYADGVQVGDTEDVDGSGSSGELNFDGIDLDIEANEQSQFVLTADTDTSAAGCTLDISFDDARSTIDDINGDELDLSSASLSSDSLAFLDGGELTVSLDSGTTDRSLLVADTSGNSLASWKFSADNDDIRVTDIYIDNQSTGDTLADGRIEIYKLLVDGVVVDTASPLTGDIEFNIGSADPIIVPRNESITVEVQADFNEIDDENKTGALYELKLYSVEAVSDATGIDLGSGDISGVQEGDAATAAGTGVTAEEHQLVKTKPTLTMVSVGTSLNDGTEEELYAVKIAADSNDDVTVYGLSFEVTLSDTSADASTLTIDTYELADSSGGLDDYDCTDSDGGDAAQTTADGSSETIVITCTYDGTGVIESVNSGSSRTFYLRADVLDASDDDKITTSMKEEATDYAAADSAADVDTAEPTSAIIWADNSGTDEDITVDQWFSDHEVDGLNTSSVSLEG